MKTKSHLVEAFLKAPDRAPRSGQRECFLCSSGLPVSGTTSDCVTESDGKVYCIPCASSLLRFVLLPTLENDKYFLDVETNAVAAIQRVEEDERMGRTNVPLGVDPDLEPETWDCARCSTQNKQRRSRCEACEFPKPEPPVCSLCFRDFTRFRICHFNKQAHELWRCGECQTMNIDRTIQCRRCRNKRTFFCPKCSTEILASTSGAGAGMACPSCGYTEGLAGSLGSLANRQELELMGLNLSEMLSEREVERSAEENRERLQYRIDQICLSDVPTEDDGNCMFRALSYQLVRDTKYYACVRYLCAEYMRNHPREFEHFLVDKDVSTAADELGRDKVWGDEIALRAAAYALPANIHVLTSDTTHWHVKYYTVSRRHVILCYARPRHYSCATLRASDMPPPNLSSASLLAGLVRDEAWCLRDDESEKAAFRGAPLPRDPKGEEGGAKEGKGLDAATEAVAPRKEGQSVMVGPKGKDLLPSDPKARSALVRIAKTPSHRVTLADLHRVREPIIVTVTLGDTSTRLAKTERREIVGRTVEPLHFYLILLDADKVAKNFHNNFTSAQRLVKWELFFPLFVLQRVDSVEYLTPNTLGGVEDVPFGALQRTATAASLTTRTITEDYSPALMVADESSTAATLFTLRFIDERLPCRHLVHLDNERIYASENAEAATLWSLQMPYPSDKQRYCIKCRIFYRRDAEQVPGGCEHRHCVRRIRLYEDD